MNDKTEDEARVFVDTFKENFRSKFGTYPEVFYKIPVGQNIAKIDMLEIENAVNSSNPLYEPPGIRKKTRKNPTNLYRQVFCYICWQNGYIDREIAEYLRHWKRVVVYYSINKVKSLLEVEDSIMTTAYNGVMEKLKARTL